MSIRVLATSLAFGVACAAPRPEVASTIAAPHAAERARPALGLMSPLKSLPGHTLRMVSFAPGFLELHFEPPHDPSAVVIEFNARDIEQPDSSEHEAAVPYDDGPNMLWASIRAYTHPTIHLEARVIAYPAPEAREAFYQLLGRVVEHVTEVRRDHLELVFAGNARVRIPLQHPSDTSRPAAHFRQRGVTGIYK